MKPPQDLDIRIMSCQNGFVVTLDSDRMSGRMPRVMFVAEEVKGLTDLVMMLAKGYVPDGEYESKATS